MKHTALVMVDMQWDFLQPSSPLFVAQGPDVLTNVAEALQAARAAGMPVVHVVRRHRSTGIDVDMCRRELFERTGGFLLAGTPGAEEPGALRPLDSEVVVAKTRWSGFFATDLDLVLRRMETGHIVLVVLQTPNCIRATAVDALSLDYAVSVLSDATGSRTVDVQRSNLEDMTAMGVEILSTQQFVALVRDA
jgi:nicotinamidase-related amidase